MENFNKKDFFEYFLSEKDNVNAAVNEIDGVKFLGIVYPSDECCPFLAASIGVSVNDLEMSSIKVRHVVPFGVRSTEEEIHIGIHWVPTNKGENDYAASILQVGDYTDYNGLLRDIFAAINRLFYLAREGDK